MYGSRTDNPDFWRKGRAHPVWDVLELFKLALGGHEPDAFGGGGAKRNGSCGRGESQGLIVIAFEETQLRTRADAAVFEEFEEAAVAFVDSADGVGEVEFCVGEQDEAAAAAAGGAFEFAEIAVRTFAAGA